MNIFSTLVNSVTESPNKSLKSYESLAFTNETFRIWVNEDTILAFHWLEASARGMKKVIDGLWLFLVTVRLSVRRSIDGEFSLFDTSQEEPILFFQLSRVRRHGVRKLTRCQGAGRRNICTRRAPGILFFYLLFTEELCPRRYKGTTIPRRVWHEYAEGKHWEWERNWSISRCTCTPDSRATTMAFDRLEILKNKKKKLSPFTIYLEWIWAFQNPYEALMPLCALARQLQKRAVHFSAWSKTLCIQNAWNCHRIVVLFLFMPWLVSRSYRRFLHRIRREGSEKSGDILETCVSVTTYVSTDCPGNNDQYI